MSGRSGLQQVLRVRERDEETVAYINDVQEVHGGSPQGLEQLRAHGQPLLPAKLLIHAQMQGRRERIAKTTKKCKDSESEREVWSSTGLKSERERRGDGSLH